MLQVHSQFTTRIATSHIISPVWPGLIPLIPLHPPAFLIQIRPRLQLHTTPPSHAPLLGLSSRSGRERASQGDPTGSGRERGTAVGQPHPLEQRPAADPTGRSPGRGPPRPLAAPLARPVAAEALAVTRGALTRPRAS